MNFIEFV